MRINWEGLTRENTGLVSDRKGFYMISLETERLHIRNYQEKDIRDFYDYMSLEFTALHEDFEPLTYEQSRDLIMKRLNDDSFAIVELKSEKRCIGDLCFRMSEYGTFEIGYDFNVNYGKKGYATEACKAFVQYLFTSLNARRVTAGCNEDNEASWRLLDRLGFRREGRFIEDVSFKCDKGGNPLYVNSVYYGILKREWTH